MAQQGWYPDPGGAPGMYRYWDGAAWSEVISPTPLPGPPSAPGAPGNTPVSGPAVLSGSTASWGRGTPGAGGAAPGAGNPSAASSGAAPGAFPLVSPGSPQRAYDGTQPLLTGTAAAQGAYGNYQTLNQKSKKPIGMWITIIIGVLVLALIVFFVVKMVMGSGGDEDQPPSLIDPTSTLCPQQSTENARADHPQNDGWVYGGALAYPQLPDPWSDVITDDNNNTLIPFGRDTAEQLIVIHPSYTPNSSWVISVMVGELYAGDGFYEPEDASQIVNRCIFGAFYGDNPVTADTLRSESYSVDGYEGWITETNLSFSIPNLPTTSELAIVIIVKTSSLSSSIFYASIPNDATQYQPDVDNAIDNLKVVT